jgi:molybdopterin-binding protein
MTLQACFVETRHLSKVRDFWPKFAVSNVLSFAHTPQELAVFCGIPLEAHENAPISRIAGARTAISCGDAAQHASQERRPGAKVMRKISARNILEGTVKEIKKGTTTAHVLIDVGGQTVMASITNESVDDLGLKVGQKAKAIIKSSEVMVGVD